MSMLHLLSLWLSGGLSAQGGYFLPSTSSFSTIPEVPGQPLHMSGGVTSRSLRHSASAMDLPRSGGMPAPLHEGFPMFGPVLWDLSATCPTLEPPSPAGDLLILCCPALASINICCKGFKQCCWQDLFVVLLAACYHAQN